MPFPLSPLAVVFAAVLGLWPFAFVAVVAWHLVGRRWRRIGRLGWLVPLWMLAASVGLLQLPSLLAALDAAAPPRSPILPAVAMAFSLFCAVLAWALLVGSFGSSGRVERSGRRDPPRPAAPPPQNCG
jgi:hypothetical protein